MGIFEVVQQQCDVIGKKAGINGKIIYFGLIVALFFILIGVLEEYITMTIGVLLPAHFSFKALATEDREDDKQWLTYWTVFSLFILAELFIGALLKYIPFYFFLKMAFLIWLFLPIFQGASIVYDNFLGKVFKQIESTIDSTFSTKKSK